MQDNSKNKELLKSKARSLLNNLMEDYSNEEQIKQMLLFDEKTGIFDLKELVMGGLYLIIIRMLAVVDDDRLFDSFNCLMFGLLAFMQDERYCRETCWKFIKDIWRDQNPQDVYNKVVSFKEELEKEVH